MRRSTPKKFDDALASVIGELGIQGKISRYEVLQRWPQIVGEQIAGVTRADHIEGDILFVSVHRSTWRNELLFLKRELIDKINAAMHKVIIKDIVFR